MEKFLKSSCTAVLCHTPPTFWAPPAKLFAPLSDPNLRHKQLAGRGHLLQEEKKKDWVGGILLVGFFDVLNLHEHFSKHSAYCGLLSSSSIVMLTGLFFLLRSKTELLCSHCMLYNCTNIMHLNVYDVSYLCCKV